MPKLSKQTQSALVVLGGNAIATDQLSKLQDCTIRALQTISKEENLNTLRRVFVGFGLHRIKASIGHGKFLPWLKSNVNGVGYQQCNYYMRIAAICVEKARVTKPELLALPGDQIEIPLDSDDDSKRFVEKVEKFVGGRSFNQLLEKYGIKDTKKIGGERDKGDEDPAPPIDPEQLAAQSREELSSALSTLRYLLIDENVCQRLSEDDIRAFDDSLTALGTEWRANVRKTLQVRKSA